MISNTRTIILPNKVIITNRPQFSRSRLSIRLRFSVAEAVVRRKSAEGETLGSLGEVDGADLASGGRTMSSDLEPGRSREMLRFCRSENLGIGSELGRGEFE